MALVRMFHYSCDSFDAPVDMQTQDCELELGGEWFSALAKQRAQLSGWHIGPGWALCYDCWEYGIRPKHLARTRTTEQKDSGS